MWDRWSSTLGLRVYFTRAYALSLLILKEKGKGALNNFKSSG